LIEKCSGRQLHEILSKRWLDNIEIYLEDMGYVMGGGQKLRIKSSGALCC
jgi:hypothetical protein